MQTQKQITDSMIQQLRILDPSISAEVGTPERKIIETVAQAMSEAQVDLNLLDGAFDINAKTGADLDNMLSLLGFGRQSGTKSTGYVTLSRDTATTAPIIINMGTTVFTPYGGDGATSVVFRTTTTVSIPVGGTSVIAPIEAIKSGSIGNVAANTITDSVGSPIYGITSIVNEYPTTGGTDSESDEEMKARFTTAGAFRNLAGTYDQYMALALSTISKKAIVVGPISKYQEYIQVPSLADTDGGTEYTTNLSSNTNSKHIYENSPYFVINDSGVGHVYYNPNSDFILNIDPAKKNRGDALRYADLIDPTSTDAPIIYQPNITFTNVYTGLAANKPSESIAPEDILLFEHSYMSSASRNDYDRNILNCVDVYVDGSDVKSANATIARPGVSVPTFIFVNDTTSAFHVDNYRRVNEPEHRPVIGNIYTPLYKQPVTDLPNQISLTTGTFLKDVHYWLVEETTSLYGTVRARNGIEWSSTIPAKSTKDSDTGPFTGPSIIDNTSSSTYLATAIPSSGSVSTTTVAQTYTPTTVVSTSSVATLTIPNHTLQKDDIVSIAGLTSGSALNGVRTITGVTSGASGTITFDSTTAVTSYTNAVTNAVTLTTIAAANTTPIKVATTDPFPESGYVLINNEILKYTSETDSTPYTFTISNRGQFGTTKAAIPASGATVSVLMEVTSTTGLPNEATNYLRIENEQMQYSIPKSTSTSLIRITERASNGSYVSSHSANSLIDTLFTSVDQSILVEGYQYDENIVTLQSALETNKQVTTDVLAHKSKVRYFKPDITIMYSPGVNRAAVNESIRLSLVSYFRSLYFGSEIQMSDILQTVHNVGGVDNVRWSKDGLDESGLNYDTNGDARPRIVETNQYGKPVGSPVLDRIEIGNGVTPTEYRIYLPYVPSTLNQNTLSAPVNVTASLNYPSSVVTTLGSNSGTSATLNVTDSTGMYVGMTIQADGISTTRYITAISGNALTLNNTVAWSGVSGAVHAIPPSSPTYISTGKTYSYVITALNNVGETIASSVVTQATGSVFGYAAINLDWDAVDGATHYKVYRNTTGTSFTTGPNLLIEIVNDNEGTSFNDLGEVENPQLPGIPPIVNTATISDFTPEQLSFFNIQYSKNEPIEIQYDDFSTDIYDADKSYSTGDIVLYGSTYYRSLLDDNANHDPTDPGSNVWWVVDTVNKIGFQSKINNYGTNNIVTVTDKNGTYNFNNGPSFTNYLTIKYINPSSTEVLQITSSTVNSGSGVFEQDFKIGDDELGSLPVGQMDSNGNLDLSSVITLRAKSQNTWGNVT